jgi:hypothetical protein
MFKRMSSLYSWHPHENFFPFILLAYWPGWLRGFLMWKRVSCNISRRLAYTSMYREIECETSVFKDVLGSKYLALMGSLKNEDLCLTSEDLDRSRARRWGALDVAFTFSLDVMKLFGVGCREPLHDPHFDKFLNQPSGFFERYKENTVLGGITRFWINHAHGIQHFTSYPLSLIVVLLQLSAFRSTALLHAVLTDYRYESLLSVNGCSQTVVYLEHRLRNKVR